MKYAGKSFKSILLSIVLGATFITFGTSDIAKADVKDIKAWVGCKTCNFNAKKCKNEKYYTKCRAQCPQTPKNDPIKKCNDVYYASIKPSKESSILPSNNDSADIGSFESLSKMSCQQRRVAIINNAMIAHSLGIEPYSEKEKEQIRGEKCSEAMTSLINSESSFKKDSPNIPPPPQDMPPPLPVR